jgi:hypothetical protein
LREVKNDSQKKAKTSPSCLGRSFFILSSLIAIVITFATVSIQAIKAALANPSDALRYE